METTPLGLGHIKREGEKRRDERGEEGEAKG